MNVLITKEQCNNLIDFPDINPITKRKLNKSALNGLYKKLLKECNELYSDKISIQNSVMESLQYTLGKMDNIETRVHNLKVMRKYISMISPCIVSSTLTSHMLSLVKKDKGRFTDIIYFNKRIGSDSSYGVAYLNTGVGEGRKLVFSTKIMMDKYKTEIDLLEKMSYAVQNHITPNFPIIYKVLHCTTVKEKKNNLYDSYNANNLNDIIKNNKYYVILNELANGDLFNFLKNVKHSSIEYESILIQALISLHTFHIQTNYIHNDSHFGNFLYHKIKKGGYWHYKYKNTDIYVPNTGYLLVLWDPGLAHKIIQGTEYMPYTDYYRLFSILKSYIDEGKIDLPQDIYIQLKLLIQYVLDKSSDINSIMKYFEKKPTFQHILYTLPLNETIINKKPYFL